MLDYEIIDEKRLISLYLQGDMKALNILLERIRPIVLRIVNSYVKDINMSQDYTQDILIKVKYNFDNNKYQPIGSFYSWLRRLTFNYVGDDLRHRSCCGLNSIVSIDLCNEIKDISYDELEEIVDREMRIDFIHSHLNLLPSPQIEVLRYRFFDDLSFKEIAVKLDVSINTVLGRCRYGINNLRKYATVLNE